MQPLDDARSAQAPCSVVVLTYNRAATVLETLGNLAALDEPWPIVVVDNGSTDGTADQIAARFPDITLVRVPRNYGAAGRNFGVASIDTPYVAFCDDDTAWLPGSVARAVDVLQRYPSVGVVAAHVVVGPTRRDDTACEPMATSNASASTPCSAIARMARPVTRQARSSGNRSQALSNSLRASSARRCVTSRTGDGLWCVTTSLQ